MMREMPIARWARIQKLPPRKPDSHKGTYGHVYVVGGAAGMGGACALTALAAYRAGAGLVSAVCQAESLPFLAAWVPEALTLSWSVQPSTQPGMVLALGPGLGGSDAARAMLDTWRSMPVPQVWDADALNLLSERGGLDASAHPRILTPHPGEAARLLRTETAAIQADRVAAARAIARQYQSICILKGHGSLVSDSDDSMLCADGNPGMATGGSGDVLTGVLAALLAQGMKAWDAALMAVCWHARAGDLAAREQGVVSLIARDIITSLPKALKGVECIE